VETTVTATTRWMAMRASIGCRSTVCGGAVGGQLQRDRERFAAARRALGHRGVRAAWTSARPRSSAVAGNDGPERHDLDGPAGRRHARRARVSWRQRR
jgi:hypothetical protein